MTLLISAVEPPAWLDIESGIAVVGDGVLKDASCSTACCSLMSSPALSVLLLAALHIVTYFRTSLSGERRLAPHIPSFCWHALYLSILLLPASCFLILQAPIHATRLSRRQNCLGVFFSHCAQDWCFQASKSLTYKRVLHGSWRRRSLTHATSPLTDFLYHVITIEVGNALAAWNETACIR